MFGRIDNSMQNTCTTCLTSTLKISQIFKKCVEDVYENDDHNLEGIEKSISLAYFMKHCCQKIPFFVDCDPDAKTFEMNCKQFMVELEIHKVSLGEHDLACSGNFTWEHLENQRKYPAGPSNYLAHFTHLIFFSPFSLCNDFMLDTSEDDEGFRDALEEPCENSKFDKYKESVLCFVQEIMKNTWHVENTLEDPYQEITVLSPYIEEILSRVSTRITVDYIKRFWRAPTRENHESHELSFVEQLNSFIYNFNYENYFDWKLHMEYYLSKDKIIDRDRPVLNFIQIADWILTRHFHVPENERISRINRLNYSFFLFFLDLLEIQPLNNCFTRFHPNYFFPIDTSLSEVTIERICEEVLIHFHPRPHHSCGELKTIAISQLPESKNATKAFSIDTFHVVGINRVFVSLFQEKQEQLPQIFRRGSYSISSAKIVFVLDDTEIKTVKLSGTLLHFLKRMPHEYLIFHGGKTIYFQFAKYFDLSEFQDRRSAEMRESRLSLFWS